MKYIYFSISILLATLLAACGGGSSSSSSGGGKPPATIAITTANANSVSKGAMTSQSAADTSSTTATNSLKSAGSIPFKLGALSIALQNTQLAQALPFPAANTPKAVSGYPKKFDCATDTVTTNSNNIYTVNITDADNNGSLSIGDTVSVTYTNCVPSTNANATMNGTSSLTFNSVHAGQSTPSDPLSLSLTVSYSSLTVAYTTPSETDSLNGSMTFSYSWDGTTLTAGMSGPSFTVTDSNVGSVNSSNFSIVETISASIWTYSNDQTITMTPNGGTSGTVNISTPTKFSGPLGGNPTSGQLRIDGANGTYITITANSNGTDATVVVYDGTTTTTNPAVPWSQIM
jgi:hypothetical protein